MSIMKFYRAEILYAKAMPDKTGTDSAFRLYSDNREIFRLYNESLETFEAAIPVA